MKAAAPYIIKTPASTSNMRIIHANGNFAVGGSTQLIVDLIELASDAYQHEVIVPQLPSSLPYRPILIESFPISEMQALRDKLRARRPTLVHIHYWSREENRFDPTGVWYATVLAVCEQLSIPVVQNINVPTRPMSGVGVKRNVYVSHSVLETFDPGKVRSESIHPGSDFSVFDQPETGHLPDSIGMTYRLDGDKLNKKSIEPFIEVARARPSTKCIIVGDGQLTRHYENRVREAGLQARFNFVGMASYADLPGWYAKMGVFVAPVHNESFGQVTPFAMGMRLPVAGYAVGALPEILGSSSTLATPGDEAALARLILDLLARPEERRRLGTANRDRARRLFSREAMVARYKALYAEVLGAP